MRRLIVRAASLVLLGAAAALVGTATAEAPAALPYDVVSTIGVARVADELGDGVLMAWLQHPERRDLSLFATRAAPFAHEPEKLIAGLSALACGRDPLLAPEAAQALLALADSLSLQDLARREVLSSDLRTAQKSLQCEDSPAPRPDIALALSRLEARIAAELGDAP